MKLIKSLFKKFITNDKKTLGRWEIDHCIKKTDRKIELANEDHCGPCGQYILNKKYDLKYTVIKDTEIKDTEIKKS